MARLTPEQLSTERYTDIFHCLSQYGPAPRTLLSKHYGIRPLTRLVDEGFLRTTRTVLGTVVTYRHSHPTLELAEDLSGRGPSTARMPSRIMRTFTSSLITSWTKTGVFTGTNTVGAMLP